MFARHYFETDGQRRTADSIDRNAGSLRRLDLLRETARLAALLRQDRLRLKPGDQGGVIFFFVIDKPFRREPLLTGFRQRFLAPEDAEPAVVPLPIRAQFPDGLHARERQKTGDAVGFQQPDSLRIIGTPVYGSIFAHICALDPYNGQVERLSDSGHSLMQDLGEGMRGIDQQPDAVFRAEGGHRGFVEGAGHVGAVLALDLLQVAAGRVPIGRARRVGHPDRQPSFRRSAENQDHGRNRCLNSWA